MIIPLSMLGKIILPGVPVGKTFAFGTAYQSDDTSKPCIVSFMVETNYTVTLAGTQLDEVELRIGPDANVVAASNPTGFRFASFKQSLTGIALVVGLGQINRGQLFGCVPAGWYFGVRRLAGNSAVINSAYIQPVG